MKILKSSDEVKHYFLNVINFQVQRRLYHLLEITLHVLHHYVELLEVVQIFRFKDFNDLNDRVMAKFSHERDLS